MAEPEIAPFAALDLSRMRGAADAWLALIGQEHEIVDALRADVVGTPLAEIQFLDLANAPAQGIGEMLHGVTGKGAVLSGFGRWTQAQWDALDVNRAELEGRGPIILLVSGAAARRLARFAPHVSSLVGGSFFRASDDICEVPPGEKRKRLKRLQTHFGMTKREVLQKREGHVLPLDEPLAEWLVLVKRGDLL